MPFSPTERRLRAQQASYEPWGVTVDRTARTAPARAALDQTFVEKVPPEITDPVARAKAAEALRKAHFARLALLSAKSRRARKAGGDAA